MFSDWTCGASDGKQGSQICGLVLALQHHRESRRERHGTRSNEGAPASGYAVNFVNSPPGSQISFTCLVEGRLYTESMTLGATTKSNPSANKIDETELERLRKQDYWLVVTRNKLLLDVIFVCELTSPDFCLICLLTQLSVRLFQRETWKSYGTNAGGLGRCLLEVRRNPTTPCLLLKQPFSARGSCSPRRARHSRGPGPDPIPTFSLSW